MRFLINKFRDFGENIAFIYKENTFTYNWLLESIQKYQSQICNLDDLSIFSVNSDCDPQSVSFLRPDNGVLRASI